MTVPGSVPRLSSISEGMVEANNYYDWIYSALRPYLARSVLEIGLGYGNIAERIIRDGLQYYAIDIEGTVMARLKEILHLPEGHLISGDVASAKWQDYFRQASVDSVLSMNVLEHIRDDVGHLRTLARCVPGGRVALFVPAGPALYGTMDKEAGHFRRYNLETLRAVVEQAGLKLRHIDYFNGMGAATWFISNRILRCHLHEETTNRSIAIYDRFITPFARMVDGALRKVMGQSIIAAIDCPS